MYYIMGYVMFKNFLQQNTGYSHNVCLFDKKYKKQKFNKRFFFAQFVEYPNQFTTFKTSSTFVKFWIMFEIQTELSQFKSYQQFINT